MKPETIEGILNDSRVTRDGFFSYEKGEIITAIKQLLRERIEAIEKKYIPTAATDPSPEFPGNDANVAMFTEMAGYNSALSDILTIIAEA